MPMPQVIRRAGAATVVSLLLLGAAGCGSAPEAQPAEATLDADLVVERREWGGLCPRDSCESLLRVRGTGEWTYEPRPAGSASTGGALDAAQQAGLAEAMASTRVGEPLPEGDCPPAYDGEAVDYGWQDSSGSGEWSTCGSVVDPDDPLVQWLDQLASEVAE